MKNGFTGDAALRAMKRAERKVVERVDCGRHFVEIEYYKVDGKWYLYTDRDCWADLWEVDGKKWEG